MKLLAASAALSALILYFPAVGSAHFGMLIPSRSTVMQKDRAQVEFDIAFAHPFARQGMDMEKPAEFFVLKGKEKTNLTDTLKPGEFFGHKAFAGACAINRPGVYIFGLIPRPYFEPAEDCFIIHYAKTVIGAYGGEDGWDAPAGLPVEIIPLLRPFANYAGNVFTGKVLKNGRPAPHTLVEVEFLNDKSSHRAPNAYFETQAALTDENGVFAFGIPWPGWWGFAALVEGDEKLEKDGQKKDVELGGVLWMEFAAPQEGK